MGTEGDFDGRRPGTPKEQRSYADKSGKAPEDVADSDRCDLQTGQPGDSDVNLGEQGRFGNLKQNLTNKWKVQDR